LLKTLKYVDTPLGPVAEWRYQLALAAMQLKEFVEARELLHSAAADFKQRSNYARVADCSSMRWPRSAALIAPNAEADEWIRQAVRYGLKWQLSRPTQMTYFWLHCYELSQ
jgi:hypothetical protein